MENNPFPNKKYNIIYADPPWAYRDKAKSGNRGVEFKYPTMTSTEIKNLPIHTISHDNCALFLWCTAPQIPIGLEVITAWGFVFKTFAFTWIKLNPKTPTLFWGMGNYTRSNPEFCLLGIKGSLKRINAGIHSVIEEEIIKSPREQHSKKPNLVRTRIDSLFGDIPRIELFARNKYQGWDAWGNEL